MSYVAVYEYDGGVTPGETQAWQAAIELAHHLAGGDKPAAMPPTIALVPEEAQWAHLSLEMWLFYEMDAWGRTWRQAKAKGRPQWRPYGTVDLVVTNMRILIRHQGQWDEYPPGAIVRIQPDGKNWQVTIEWDGAPPMMLRGLWAPWLAVLVTAGCQGSPWTPTR